MNWLPKCATFDEFQYHLEYKYYKYIQNNNFPSANTKSNKNDLQQMKLYQFVLLLKQVQINFYKKYKFPSDTLTSMMNMSINSRFGSTFQRSSIQNNLQQPSAQILQLLEMIEQYENQAKTNQQTQQQKKQEDLIQLNNISQICVESYIKNNPKPVRMFKDQMQLRKENHEKRIIVKQLQAINKQLKMEYDISLNNNKKMEMFLKQIQFTFKNDQSNQKANETLLKATKTLHREKYQSKNYIQKLVKTAKSNQMRELKTYLKILQNQKKRLTQILAEEVEENKKLRQDEDFNQSELQTFQMCQNLVTQILSSGLKMTQKMRQSYKKQKSIIKIELTYKEVEYIKRQISRIDLQISSQLLKKQGLQYQIQLLKNRMKQKNKRNIREQGSILKQQIKQKKRRINLLKQQLKQKIKTQEYIYKWTKQLKIQLEELKENHILIKEEYQEQINKLSRQIQQWNRKYKAQLIQQQTINKKNTNKGLQTGSVNTTHVSKIRVVKILDIMKFAKKIIFYSVENKLDPLQYVIDNLFRGIKVITLKELHRKICALQIFEDENQSQLYKFARYIVEDNNNDYTKINPEQSIDTSLAILIFKNLLLSDLPNSNIPSLRLSLKQFLLKNFDEVRHEIWLNSGKSATFTLTNLKNSFSNYIKQVNIVAKYTQYVEYLLWKKFGQADLFKLSNFQKICQTLLDKKLIKDSQNIISKMTIKSVFEGKYNSQVLQGLLKKQISQQQVS